jgi:hypothetical protein
MDDRFLNGRKGEFRFGCNPAGNDLVLPQRKASAAYFPCREKASATKRGKSLIETIDAAVFRGRTDG